MYAVNKVSACGSAEGFRKILYMYTLKAPGIKDALSLCVRRTTLNKGRTTLNSSAIYMVDVRPRRPLGRGGGEGNWTFILIQDESKKKGNSN